MVSIYKPSFNTKWSKAQKNCVCKKDDSAINSKKIIHQIKLNNKVYFMKS